jgi:hypothetical protein
MSILDLYPIQRLRRNHGLEHATLTILTQRVAGLRMAGYSFPAGFILLGEVTLEQVQQAVTDALTRLNNGEGLLAVHPNCGTNLATSGFLAGGLAWLAMLFFKDKRSRIASLPLAIVFAMTGLVIGQPLGLKIQERITTSGIPGGLAVKEISQFRVGKLLVHRILTEG